MTVKKEELNTRDKKTRGGAKACRIPFAEQWNNIGLEKAGIEFENCKGTTEGSVEKEGSERDDGPTAGNNKEPVTEAGEWTEGTRGDRRGHKEANKMPLWGDAEMVDGCTNVRQGTKGNIESGEDEIT